MPSNVVTALKQRRYFVILDQDAEHPSKPYFEIVLFEIRKDDTFYKELTYIDKPFFHGQLQFEKEEATGKLVPFRLLKRVKDPATKEYVLKVVDADNIRNFIINAEFVVVGNHLNTPQGHVMENWQTIDTKEAGAVQKAQMDFYMKQLGPVYEYLDVLQYTKIRSYLFCHHCKIDKKYTLIGEETRYKSQAFYICRECAGKEIVNLLKTKIEITPQMKQYLRDLLMKYNDINKVLNVFAPNFNILDHPEATLVDISKAQESARKVKPMEILEVDIPPLLQFYYITQRKLLLLPAQIMALENGLLEGQSELIISATSSGKTMIGELTGFSKILADKIIKVEKNGTANPFQAISREKFNAWKKTIQRDDSETVEKDAELDFEYTQEQQEYIKKLLGLRSQKRMLYLVPIVALANMRHNEYKQLAKFGIRSALRIGVSYLHKRKQNTDEFGNVSNADVIIATYEAIDILCRSGHVYLLKDVATVVIDEIQMLADPERGFVLDGLIARLRIYLPKTQFIFLSATVSKPKDLADHFRSALIQYEERPIPVEKHLVMCLDEGIKLRNISNLVHEEFKKVSTLGFKGQTIIFTNSRRNTDTLAEYLNKNHIKAMSYHAGLGYDERRMVERNFVKQRIACVVTTAALAAGVDFPASQVIFASMMMGIKWLTVAEFEQMSGRAGRLGKHNLGKVFLLIIPGQTNTATQSDTEEHMAVQLLKGKIEPLELQSDDNAHYTEINAVISMYTDLDPRNMRTTGISGANLRVFHAYLYNNSFDLDFAIQFLLDHHYIQKSKTNLLYSSTTFGRAVADSFLKVDQANEIRDLLMQKVTNTHPPPDLLNMAQIFHPLNNIYITNRLLSDMSSKTQARPKSNNLFSNAILSLMTADNLGKKNRLSPHIFDVLLKWSRDIFNCKCKENPYCDCGREQIQNRVLDYRLNGLSIQEIVETLIEEYEIQLFPNDVTGWYEQIIYDLLAIQKIGKTITLPAETLAKLQEIPQIIASLISPQKSADKSASEDSDADDD